MKPGPNHSSIPLHAQMPGHWLPVLVSWRLMGVSAALRRSQGGTFRYTIDSTLNPCSPLSPSLIPSPLNKKLQTIRCLHVVDWTSNILPFIDHRHFGRLCQ